MTTKNTAPRSSAQLVVDISKPLRAQYMAAKSIRIMGMDTKDWAAFEDLVELHMANLLHTKNQQHQANERPKFSWKACWAWFQEERKPLLEKYKLMSMTKGGIAADEFMRAEWEAAHPKKPAGRPRGLLTETQLRAVANALALSQLLREHAPPTARRGGTVSNGLSAN
jgi:hypothetical protein